MDVCLVDTRTVYRYNYRCNMKILFSPGKCFTIPLQSMKAAIEEVMPQVISNYNDDAWDNCLSVVVDGISAGLA